MIKFDLQKRLSGSQGELQLQLRGSIAKGDFITLSGDSGAGKTTLLRMIAGLTPPDYGNLTIDNTTCYSSDKNISLKPQVRNVALVFQDLALFPNMSALENIHYAAPSNSTIDIGQLLSVMELGALRNHQPNKLSRGQQQRVAIARAIAQEPQLLLLDEPFSAVDIDLKIKLLEYLKKVHQNYNLTTILVTHDPGSTEGVSTKSWILRDGVIHHQDQTASIEDGLLITSAEKVDGKWSLIIEDQHDLNFKAGMKVRKL